MDLEVRHLRVVCAIADAGSLTRAAAALGLTQPGLSAQLRRIEAMLGGVLFERQPAGTVPTHFGELVLGRARAVLPGIDGLLADTARAARRERAPDQVRIGSVGAPLLGHLLLAVKALLPGADLTSRCAYSPVALLDDLAAGRLEAAVLGDHPGEELPPRPGVRFHPLVTEPVFALLPAGHPLARREEVALADLLDEDWAVPRPDGDRTPEYWSSVCALTGRRPHTPYEADGRQLIELVRAGLAVSLCQATFIEVPGIAVRPLVGDPLWYRHVLAWRHDSPLAPVAPALLHHVATGYRETAAAGRAYAAWQRSSARARWPRSPERSSAKPNRTGRADPTSTRAEAG
ncbi:LysR family transcriptional regulator [Streptomyces bambusae]|uniref:LysR family transcriptional regulator n=1 Tax=Streptomyces bambusae TaxID=1550616 RepID=A0ABS6ZDQ5_9ACTN|nr:LysR family transcriptional regulator [Streptomyces bambusae]MBW5485544.1 LysR family transcriptional regulator [Streptomyces bambusae]